MHEMIQEECISKKKDTFYLGSRVIQITAAVICFLVTFVMVYLVCKNPDRRAILSFVVLTFLAVMSFLFVLLTFVKGRGIFLFLPAVLLILTDLIWILPLSDALAGFTHWILVLISLISIVCLVRFYQCKSKNSHSFLFALLVRDLILYCPMFIDAYNTQFFGGWYLVAVVAVTLLLPILFKFSIVLTIVNIKRKEPEFGLGQYNPEGVGDV